jgi:hypothetical protein
MALASAVLVGRTMSVSNSVMPTVTAKAGSNLF